MWYLQLLTTMLIFLIQIFFVQCNGIFEVLLVSMRNPSNLLSSGQCCGSSSRKVSSCPKSCNTYLDICLFLRRALPCIRESKSQKYRASNIDSKSFNHKSRLIQMPFTFSWQGFFGLKVAARDAYVDNYILKSQIMGKLLPGKTWKSVKHQNRTISIEYNYRVVCAQDYYGPGCIKYCKARDDEHGGHWNCSRNGDRVCLPGWNGTYCNRAICKYPCLNGRCSAPGKCSCLRGWSGPQCSQCLPRSSCVHGKCFRGPGDCSCNSGWGGINCDKEMDYCGMHRPCKNGALCTNENPGEFKCVCKPGHTGKRCETNITTCKVDFCKNGGKCKDTMNGPRCVCPNHTTGLQCESIIRGICYPGYCFNGGSCIAVKNITICRCVIPYAGPRCKEQYTLTISSSFATYSKPKTVNTENILPGKPTERLSNPSLIISYAPSSIDISASVFLGSVSLVTKSVHRATDKLQKLSTHAGSRRSKKLDLVQSITTASPLISINATSVIASHMWNSSATPAPTASAKITPIKGDSATIPVAAAITVSVSILIILVLLVLFLWRRVHKYRRPSRISQILPAGFMLPGALLEPVANGTVFKIGTSTSIDACREDVEAHGKVNNTYEEDTPEERRKNNNNDSTEEEEEEEGNVDTNTEVERLDSDEDMKNAYTNNGYSSGSSSGYNSQTSSARSSATYRKRDSIQTKSIETFETEDSQDELIHQTSHNLKHVSFEGLPNYIMYSEESI